MLAVKHMFSSLCFRLLLTIVNETFLVNETFFINETFFVNETLFVNETFFVNEAFFVNETFFGYFFVFCQRTLQGF